MGRDEPGAGHLPEGTWPVPEPPAGAEATSAEADVRRGPWSYAALGRTPEARATPAEPATLEAWPDVPVHPDDEAAGLPEDGAAGPDEELAAGNPRTPGALRPPAVPTILDRWRSGRVDPGRRGVAALAVVALLAAALAGFVVLRARPDEVAPPPVVATGVPVPGSSAAASPTPGLEVVVSVGGKVARPGLLRLPTGSRVDDALTAAGGAVPGTDLTGLNLARRLVDGEQLLVGVPQPVAPAGAPSSGGAATGTGTAGQADAPIDLNTATLAQFDSLPGIGPVLAQKLLDWRTEHGRFGSVDQLREVSGIGESKYAEIKDKVRV